MTLRQPHGERESLEDSGPLRTLIVDDEPLAIERMQVLCAEIDTLNVVGTASDGDGAGGGTDLHRWALLLNAIGAPAPRLSLLCFG